jgi:hypothetical protein
MCKSKLECGSNNLLNDIKLFEFNSFSLFINLVQFGYKSLAKFFSQLS